MKIMQNDCDLHIYRKISVNICSNIWFCLPNANINPCEQQILIIYNIHVLILIAADYMYVETITLQSNCVRSGYMLFIQFHILVVSNSYFQSAELLLHILTDIVPIRKTLTIVAGNEG